MIIVTSGNRYIDIDAYASCIAYANLLNLKGFNAKAVSTAKLNESITDSLIKLPEKIEKHYATTGNEKYIILDVSDKNFFDNIVIENNIIEIIDHHYGYENYWNKKLKEHSHIEKIGSIATFIFELYEKEQLIDKISNGMAKLLISAILDNTLNLKAQSTTKRDISASHQISSLSFSVCRCPKGCERCLGKLAQERGIRIDRDCPSDCLRLSKYGLTPLCVSGCKLLSDEL